MSNTSSQPATPPSNQPAKKSRGMIRWEALLPAIVVLALIGIYFTLFFDHHLKSAIEFVGYKALGAEVNVEEVKTSFKNANFTIRGLELTDAENPTHNLVSIGEIKFDLLWDALLRAKFVVEVAAVKQIQFKSQRKKKGRVKPPTPEDDEPSFLEKEGKKLADEALENAKESYGDNVVGDIANLLSGGSSDEQLQKLKDSIKAKEVAANLEKTFAGKQAEWDEKIKALSKKDFIKSYNESFKAIKTSDFKSPEELQTSLKKADGLIKGINKDLGDINQTSQQLKTDLAGLESQLSNLDDVIKADIKNLESHFKIPKIDAQSITQSLFKRYTSPILGKVNKYQSMVNHYLPPGLTAKDKKEEKAPEVIPHPRERGISYEFGKPHSYPLFWIRKTQISSKATPGVPALGNIDGEALNISSNQTLTGHPIQVNLKANFPELHLEGIEANLTLNHLQTPFKETLMAQIASYPVEKKRFVESKDFEFGFDKALGQASIKASYSEKIVQFDLSSSYSNLETVTKASQKELDGILKTIMSQIPKWTISASGQGRFPDIAINLQSNLGGEIAHGFERILNEKIKEAQIKVKKMIDETINKEKARLQSQYQFIKNQVEAEIKKIEDSIQKQKAEIETTISKIQKEEAKKAQKQIESELQKKLGPDAKKKLDDLKKQFKF